MGWHFKDGKVVEDDGAADGPTPMGKNMPLRVYVAGPYSRGDNFDNVRRAIDVGEQLFELGFVPFVPHLFAFWQLQHPHTWKEWLDLDVLWLERCDALLRMSGESEGADHEVRIAGELGLPVFDRIIDLRSWMLSRTKQEDDFELDSHRDTSVDHKSNGDTGSNGQDGGVSMAGG